MARDFWFWFPAVTDPGDFLILNSRGESFHFHEKVSIICCRWLYFFFSILMIQSLTDSKIGGVVKLQKLLELQTFTYSMSSYIIIYLLTSHPDVILWMLGSIGSFMIAVCQIFRFNDSLFSKFFIVRLDFCCALIGYFFV